MGEREELLILGESGEKLLSRVVGYGRSDFLGDLVLGKYLDKDRSAVADRLSGLEWVARPHTSGSLSEVRWFED